jgi:hypothetical protein
MFRPLYPRDNSPQYPLDRRLGEPQNRAGRHGEEKILDPTDGWLVINYFILLSLWFTDVIEICMDFDFIAYQNE